MNPYILNNEQTATINPTFTKRLNEASMLVYGLINYVQTVTVSGQIDYVNYAFDGIIHDFWSLTVILNNIPLGIDRFEFRPCYSILRSALEKYADMINFMEYGDCYYAYLNKISCAPHKFKYSTKDMMISEIGTFGERWMNEIKPDSNKIYNVNRSTRYYLTKTTNTKFELQFNDYGLGMLIQFNRSLKELDKNFSSILHNNFNPYTNKRLEVMEIYKTLVYVMYTSFFAYCKARPNMQANYYLYQNVCNCLSDLLNSIPNTLFELLVHQ